MSGTASPTEGGSVDRSRPFFVVAAARSGTTLLRVMLDRHPDVAIPGEGHFIPHLWAQRARYGSDGTIERLDTFLEDLARHPAFAYWDLSIDAVRDELAPIARPGFSDACEAAYRAYATSRGKTRWADKTPDYIDHIPLLSALFPRARFVHLVRDGRDVALSTIDLKRLHRRAATCAFFWSRQVGTARRQGMVLGAERYLEARYEDLLDRPEAELRRLCAFVDLDFDPVVLEHGDRELEKLPERFRTIHSRLALPPTKGLRDWRTQMSPREAAEYDAIAGGELLAHGYPAPGWPADLLTRARARSRMLGFAARYARLTLRRRLRGPRRRGRAPSR